MATKKIIFCSDGTAQEPKDQTNVFQVYHALLTTSTQVKDYDPGVGTRFGELLRGRIFGRGLSLNVRQGYQFISRNYEQGDRIFLFGFSRGAYTVRSLASMISLCGLVPPDASKGTFAEVWKAYKRNREAGFEEMMQAVKEKLGLIDADVEAVCVWDTVGSVGRQTRTKDIRKKLAHKFHRMTVMPHIQRVYHAVSLDERRTQYFPHLLHEQRTREDQVIEEVWFPGVHSDIGGGYSDDRSLAHVTLAWMLSKVGDELELREDFGDSIEVDPLGPMHNAEKGPIWSLFQKRSRPVARGSDLHKAVVRRINGPLRKFHPHREPSGNYEPLSLRFANFSSAPDFGLTSNYRIVAD